MLEELKKYNYFGTKGDIIYFLQTVIGNNKLSVKDIKALCAHTTGYYILNVDALLCLCYFCHMITYDENIKLTPPTLDVINNQERLNNFIVTELLSKLFDNNIFQSELFSFDVVVKKYFFKNDLLSLAWAPMRNLLINLGFLQIERKDEIRKFFINQSFETVLIKNCKETKTLFSIEQLRQQLEANNKAGELAESFVLEFEKRRIHNTEKANQIKIISAIDVRAGYDIVSFNSDTSSVFDRFIEVKALSYNGFHWSQMELEVAKLKSKKYFLYLVELSKISETYTPIIICNPAFLLFNSDEWLIEPHAYFVRNTPLSVT